MLKTLYVEDDRLLTTSKFLAHSIERKFRLRKPKDIILQPDDAITTFQTSEEAAAILFGSHASLFENPHLIQDIDDKIPNIAISIYTESNFMNLNISEAFLYCFFDTIRGLRTNDNKRNIVLDSIKKDELYLKKVAETLGLI